MFQNFITVILEMGEQWGEVLVKKPLTLIGKQGLKAKRMFLGLPQRQATTIYAGVLWVIPLAMVGTFTSLYMVDLGLSVTEVGVYSALMSLVSLVGYFLGGYLSDAWGRKKTLITFDILSWGGYGLCLSLADNKWWCVAAIFFLATNAGSTAPYICLLVEGIAKKSRPLVFSVLAIVNSAPSLIFLPLMGGLWVGQAGRLKACHGMFWLLFIMISVGIFLRWKFLPESPTFEKPAENWVRVFKDGLEQYRQVLGRFFKKGASRILVSSKILDEWLIWAWNIYASLFYVNHLGLKDTYLSILGPVSTYVAVFVIFQFVPQLSERRVTKVLGLDQLFGLAFLAVLLWPSLGDKNVLLFCIFSASLWAVSGALYSSITASAWMNIMEEKDRGKVVAASYALIKIGLVTGTIGAFLYGHVSPIALIYVMMGMRILNFFLLRKASAILQASK